jgi:hypothetical protein
MRAGVIPGPFTSRACAGQPIYHDDTGKSIYHDDTGKSIYHFARVRGATHGGYHEKIKSA